MSEPFVNIERISNLEYSFRKSNHLGIRHVAKALTFKNPEVYAYTQDIEMFDKKTFTFKMGMIGTVMSHLAKRKIANQITDYEFEMPKGVEIDSRLSGKYEHQENAVKSFFKRRFGIIVVPTRGGKTFIASEVIRIFTGNFDGNFLFIVDTMDLFNQAVKDIKGFFENYGGIEVGEIQAGKIDTTKRVSVGMIQTIQSTLSKRCRDVKKKKALQTYLSNLKFLCVDEIHDNSSDSRLKIYKKCKSLDFQLCLSATPFRAGTFYQNLKLQAWSGGVAYTITEKKLRERKVLSDYKVFMLLVDHNDIPYEIEADDYNEYRKKLIFESDVRNNVLVRVIGILRELNIKTLIIFQSVEHGKMIEKATGITFISGETKVVERERAKVKFLKGDGRFLSASGIFKKGITLPEVECMINIDGGLEDANTIQKKGRVLGTTATKSRSLIIDFIDIYDCYFSEHSETRLNTYVNAIGEDNVGILDVSINDCYVTLKKWIKKWFTIDKNFSDTQ